MDSKLALTYAYKTKQMQKMLFALEDAIDLYHSELKKSDLSDHEALRRCNAFRSNVTQSLEFSTEGFWKYLKTTLEDVEKIPLSSTTPKFITRTAVEYRLIDENEAISLIKMIDERNNTSHLYQEEVADEFAKYAPEALDFMQKVFKRLQENAVDLS